MSNQIQFTTIINRKDSEEVKEDFMLTLSRKEREGVVIEVDGVKIAEVFISKIKFPNRVLLSFDADKEVNFIRKEIHEDNRSKLTNS
jgi:sRNA-binding carbon storage regulator CsrA